MPRRKRPQTWSYTAGKKGKNRVRAYEREPGGDLYIEWHEPRTDAAGAHVVDPNTGIPLTRRKRESLAANGITTYAQAVVKAEELAALIDKFGSEPSRAAAATTEASKPAEAAAKRSIPAGPVTLKALLDLYDTEVIALREPETQRGYRVAARMFLAYFGADAVVERYCDRAHRPVTELGPTQYRAWMRAREEGSIPGFRTRCMRQTIISNFRFLKQVFEWGTTERDDGPPILVRNPWRKFEPPSEDNPSRPEMTADLHQRITAAARDWRMALIMEICRETRRRMNSVRNLELDMINLDAMEITWVRRFDKARKTRTTVITHRTADAVRLALELRKGARVDASPWLFPAPRDPSRPVGKSTLQRWMMATRRELGIEIPRLGYHGEKRAGIRDPRWQQLPDEWREHLSGTTVETEKRVYGFVGREAQQEAVERLQADDSRPPLAVPITRKLRRAA